MEQTMIQPAWSKVAEVELVYRTRVKTAAAYLDITVLDHIIVTREAYFSFADEGLL